MTTALVRVSDHIRWSLKYALTLQSIKEYINTTWKKMEKEDPQEIWKNTRKAITESLQKLDDNVISKLRITSLPSKDPYGVTFVIEYPEELAWMMK